MRGIPRGVSTALAVLVVGATAGVANAELIDRGPDSYGKHLIYDTVLNVTWYQPSNPNGMNWFDAHTYAANLAVVFEGRTIDDWRLPRATDVDTHVLSYWGCWAGYLPNCLGELSHLWLELGGQITTPPGGPNVNPRLPGNNNPFQTPYPEAGYAQGLFWLDETEINEQGQPYCNNHPYCPNGYVFTWFNDGYGPGGLQGVLYAYQNNYKYAWPVRDGDVLMKQYTATGFYDPVDGDSVVNVVKGGRTVPLKFNVYEIGSDAEVTETSVVEAFTVTQTACGSGDTLDNIEFTTTGGTGLRYDYAAMQFVQNWKAPKAVGCYMITLKLTDITTLSAKFQVK